MKIHTICLIIFFIFSSISVPSKVSAIERILYFVGVENGIPFAWEENGEKKGVDYEFMVEIAKRVGFKIKIDLLPLKRTLQYLKTGNVDGSFQVYFNKDRDSFLIYSALPLHATNHHVFVKKGREFDFKTVKDLYGKRVARQSGFFISHEFDEAMKKKYFIVDEAKDLGMNLKKLYNGRVDCFISSGPFAKYSLRKMGIEKEVVALPVPIIKGKGIFLALSRHGKNIEDKEAFIRKIDTTMKEIIEDGTLEKINRKYWD